MTAREKSVWCPVCHKTFKPKKNNTGKISCIDCGYIIKKKRSSSLLKQIIKPKKSKKKKTKRIETIKPIKSRHRKVKSLRAGDEISKAYIHKSHNSNQNIAKHTKTLSLSLLQKKTTKPKRKHLPKNKRIKTKSTKKFANDPIRTGNRKQLQNTNPLTIETQFFHQFMDKKYGTLRNIKPKFIDPITEILANDWERKARNANNWIQKSHLLQELKMKICIGCDYKSVCNEDFDRVCMYLVKWFVGPIKCFDEIRNRKLILNLLITVCKTYKMNRLQANQFANYLATKEWNSKTNSVSAKYLATKALLAIYYASESRLNEWKRYLIPTMKLRAVYAWQFLSGICIFGANDKNTMIKQKALSDLRMFLNDNMIVRLIRGTFLPQFISFESINQNYEVIIACSEFIFGVKHILNDIKIVDSIYSQIKNDIKGTGYAQILLSGDNAFDFDKFEKIKPKSCAQCADLNSLKIKCNNVNKELNGLRDIVQRLRVRNKNYSDEIFQLRGEVAVTDKKSKLLDEDTRDIEVEIFNLEEEIYELDRKNKRGLQMNNNFKGNKLDYKNWDSWNVDEVLQWILSVNNKRFLIYKKDICRALPIENIRGDELHLINESDLLYFGISNEDDRKVLMECIKSLVNDEYKNAMSAMSPPPIAFDVNMENVMIPINRMAKLSLEGTD